MVSKFLKLPIFFSAFSWLLINLDSLVETSTSSSESPLLLPKKKKVAMELIKAFCGDAGPLQVDGDLMFDRSCELERFWENGQIVEIWTVWEYLESK